MHGRGVFMHVINRKSFGVTCRTLDEALAHESAAGSKADDAFMKVAEQAITTAGLHPSAGYKIWAATR